MNKSRYPFPPRKHDENPRTFSNKGKWLNSREAASYLRTSIGGLRNRVYRGQIIQHKPFGKNGRSFFKRTDLDRLLESSI